MDLQTLEQVKQAAEQGDADAQFALGDYFFSGDDVVKRYSNAVEWFLKAAEQGHEEAIARLDFFPIAKSKLLYLKSAEQGNADAQCKIGVSYEKCHSWDEAVDWFRKAAEQGLAEAQDYLGECYWKGRGVPENNVEAANWFRRAAEQGNAHAQYRLGLCHEKGCGVAQDVAEAVKWYRKSIEQGCFDAEAALALFYSNAARSYRSAAEKGDAQAQYRLGYAYSLGHGVPQDNDEAIRWFRKAAEQGYTLAQYQAEQLAREFVPRKVIEDEDEDEE